MSKTLYEYENAIRKIIKDDNKCSVHFSWDRAENYWLFNLATWNPKHKSAFLLHTVPSPEFRNIKAYEVMYEYVVNLKNMMSEKNTETEYPEKHYQVSWHDTEKNKTVSSFFWGVNLGEILRKFYFDKGEDTNIYNIKLMPQS